jgi:polyphosphate kinase
MPIGHFLERRRDELHCERGLSGWFLPESRPQVRSNIVPLMIESIQSFPVLSDKSIYLACTLAKKDKTIPARVALV